MSARNDPLSEGRRFAIGGMALIALTFGGLGGWSALAMIDKGVLASGTVAVETNRKTVQHYEGGIVREILIREGDRVVEDQIVARLERVQAEANANVIGKQIDFARAREARLVAEREGGAAIDWGDLKKRPPTPELAGVMADETHQFEERRNSLEGQFRIQKSRIEQHRRELDGLGLEEKSAMEQISYIRRELEGLRELHKKQLVPSTRLFSMERERSRLEGVIGQNLANTARIQAAIGEIEEQMALARQKFNEEVATSLVDVRQKLADVQERERVAADVLERVNVRAPRAGTVQNVKLTTLGQVVRAGDALMEIVPDDEALIVSAQFSPNDIDGIFHGQAAEVRFPAFHLRNLPLMSGRIETISGDRLIDDNRQPYFLATISINRMEIPEELRTRLRPGMPAEVIAVAGKRTVVEYLIAPMRDAMKRTFLER